MNLGENPLDMMEGKPKTGEINFGGLKMFFVKFSMIAKNSLCVSTSGSSGC